MKLVLSIKFIPISSIFNKLVQTKRNPQIIIINPRIETNKYYNIITTNITTNKLILYDSPKDCLIILNFVFACKHTKPHFIAKVIKPLSKSKFISKLLFLVLPYRLKYSLKVSNLNHLLV